MSKDIANRLRAIADEIENMPINCITTAPEVPQEVQIVNCGSVLPGSTATIEWNDPTNPDPLRRYDLFIDIGDGNGFVDQGPSVQYPTSSWTVSGLPTDGRVILKRLYYWDNNVVDLTTFVECACMAATISNSGIHECVGYNILDRYQSYVKPNLTKTPTETFTSLSALQNRINSQTDHGGNVYALASGTYSGSLNIIDKRNLCIYTDPNNPALINASGQNFGINAYNNQQGVDSNIQIYNFEVINSNFHGIYLGGDDAPRYAPRNTLVIGTTVHDVAQITGGGIVVRNGFEGAPIRIECNEVYSVHPSVANIGAGEGIYIGEGNDPQDYSSNIQIVGNYLHDLNGEAIDIKRKSADILIEYNRIERINVHSQGAIVVALDPLRTNDTYDSNTIIRRNCISDVTTRNADGNFIVVANGFTLVEDNILFNTVAHGIEVYNDCDGPNKTVIIQNNIIWGYNGLPIRENVGSGNDPNVVDPCAVTRNTNIVQNNPVGSECQEPASAFVGPLTTCEGFAPA